MRNFGRIAVVFAASTALVALGQSSASALEAYCWTNDGDSGGKSCQIYHEANGKRVDSVRFLAAGEHLSITDLAADGKGVMAYVNGDVYWGAPSSYGTMDYDLKITDGTLVELKSCQTDNGRVYDCHTEYARA
ncbi:hypothetical protein [Streptomyces subrutilus]|uniref:hypothetical protein n=1 Tax=Streptomyces subrutilus TaxID=36818 RepID=UPI0033DB9022